MVPATQRIVQNNPWNVDASINPGHYNYTNMIPTKCENMQNYRWNEDVPPNKDMFTSHAWCMSFIERLQSIMTQNFLLFILAYALVS